jgi:hypothetical protein
MIIQNDIEKFIALKPLEYHILKSINISRNFDDIDGVNLKYNVDIILIKDFYNNNGLKIHCINVFYIRIEGMNGVGGISLDIKNARSWQIEGARFHIEDNEEDSFSFYCEDFFVELVRL